MPNDGIGKLERVGLREVWKHEAYDFTQPAMDPSRDFAAGETLFSQRETTLLFEAFL